MNGKRIKSMERTQAQGIGRRSVLMGLGAGAAAAVLATAGSVTRKTVAQASPPAGSAGSFLVMRRYQLASDAAISEVVQRTTEGFVPIVREVPGFIEYLNVDLGDGEGATIGIFASQASAEESTERATAWARENLADLMQGPPEVSGGPVLLQVTAEEVAGSRAGDQASAPNGDLVHRLLAPSPRETLRHWTRSWPRTSSTARRLPGSRPTVKASSKRWRCSAPLSRMRGGPPSSW